MRKNNGAPTDPSQMLGRLRKAPSKEEGAPESQGSNPPGGGTAGEANADDFLSQIRNFGKNGNPGLRKIDRSKPLGPPPEPKKPQNTSALTVQEILQQAAAIREQVKCSTTTEDDEESESSDTSW